METLIDQSKGDMVLDYRNGNEQLVQNLRAAVQNAGGKVEYALDAVSKHGSYENICQVLDQITLILSEKECKEIPKTRCS